MTGQFRYFYFSVLHLWMLTYWVLFEMVYKLFLTFIQLLCRFCTFLWFYLESVAQIIVERFRKQVTCSVIVYRLGWVALLFRSSFFCTLWLSHAHLQKCFWCVVKVWLILTICIYNFLGKMWLQWRELGLLVCTKFLAVVYIWKITNWQKIYMYLISWNVLLIYMFCFVCLGYISV